MRVLRTQIGLVMTWVATPAAKEAAKKSVGVSNCEDALLLVVVVPLALSKVMPLSARDLKKKKEAQLVALPRRFGVRPRYRAARGRSVFARLRTTLTVVRAVRVGRDDDVDDESEDEDEDALLLR